jgi:CMP-N,N'-diacetyllegionaminic acid synthase
MENKKILCIIPARSGSKGIIHKNIKIFRGKPLLAWSIEHALKCKYSKNMRIIVSTDSKEYVEIAKKWGADVPFLRPKEISGDLSTDYECIKHAIEWLKINENYNPNIILQLRPTQPCRKIEDINKCLDIFIHNYNNYDSLRTVVPFEKSPYKMYTIDLNNIMLKPLFNKVNEINEPYNQCRQILPQTTSGCPYPHSSIKETCEILVKEIDEKYKDFDTAILGCGAYGPPIINMLRKKYPNKNLCYIGAECYKMFGIYSKGMSAKWYSSAIKENWIEVLESAPPGTETHPEKKYWK